MFKALVNFLELSFSSMIYPKAAAVHIIMLTQELKVPRDVHRHCLGADELNYQ
jgi:hypothetical protein